MLGDNSPSKFLTGESDCVVSAFHGLESSITLPKGFGILPGVSQFAIECRPPSPPPPLPPGPPNSRTLYNVLCDESTTSARQDSHFPAIRTKTERMDRGSVLAART